MHICINCNKRAAVRTGDNFRCEVCGYQWDVAHEQANAAYLKAQGRRPAESVLSAQSGQPQTLDQALGLGAGVSYETPETAAAESDDDLVNAVLWEMTVSDLEALAELHKVDLGGARRKEDKIRLLRDSGLTLEDVVGS